MSASGTKQTSILTLIHVRFRGQNGHDADAMQCPLMTLSGHAPCGPETTIRA